MEEEATQLESENTIVESEIGSGIGNEIEIEFEKVDGG